MDQIIFASLSHTHYGYEVGMLKVPHGNTSRTRKFVLGGEGEGMGDVLSHGAVYQYHHLGRKVPGFSRVSGTHGARERERPGCCKGPRLELLMYL